MRYHIALYDYIYGICITTFKYSQNVLIQLNVLTKFNTEVNTKYQIIQDHAYLQQMPMF